MDKQVGIVHIEVSDPHPCWIRLQIGNQDGHSLRLEDARDLFYALGQAIKEAEHQEKRHA